MRKALIFMLGLMVACGLLISAIKVIKPNGNEIYRIGNTVTIQWDPADGGASVQIRLFHYNAKLGVLVVSTPNDGEWEWTIDKFANGSPIPAGVMYSIVVKSLATPTNKDTSDGYFVIQSKPNGKPDKQPINPELIRAVVPKLQPVTGLVASLPDLVISFEVIAVKEKFIDFRFIVRNVGSAHSTPCDVRITRSWLGPLSTTWKTSHRVNSISYNGGVTMFTESIPRVTNYHYEGGIITDQFPQCRTYLLSAYVDSNGEIKESNEDNNKADRWFYVEGNQLKYVKK